MTVSHPIVELPTRGLALPGTCRFVDRILLLTVGQLDLGVGVKAEWRAEAAAARSSTVATLRAGLGTGRGILGSAGGRAGDERRMGVTLEMALLGTAGGHGRGRRI